MNMKYRAQKRSEALLRRCTYPNEGSSSSEITVHSRKQFDTAYNKYWQRFFRNTNVLTKFEKDNDT